MHEQDFPAPMPEYDTQEASSVSSRLQEIRSVIQVAIEEQVKAKVFSKNNVRQPLAANFSVPIALFWKLSDADGTELLLSLIHICAAARLL